MVQGVIDVWLEEEDGLVIVDYKTDRVPLKLSLIHILFGQFETLMGNERMTLQVFSEILEAGFSEIQVGLIPAALDRLVVGDLRLSLIHI